MGFILFLCIAFIVGWIVYPYVHPKIKAKREFYRQARKELTWIIDRIEGRDDGPIDGAGV